MEDEFITNETAIPEARRFKHTLMDIEDSMLFYFKQYRLGGKNADLNLTKACSEMLNIFDYIEPKISEVCEKNKAFDE